MSVETSEENVVEITDKTAVDVSVISPVNDDAVGNFELKHDLLLESTDSINVVPAGPCYIFVIFFCVSILSHVTSIISVWYNLKKDCGYCTLKVWIQIDSLCLEYTSFSGAYLHSTSRRVSNFSFHLINAYI